MFRILGAFLLFLGGFGLAEALAEKEKQILRMGEAYLDFLRFLRGELHAFCRPRAEIYAHYENPLLTACGFLGALRESGEISYAVKAASPPPDPPLGELLRAFGNTQGRGYLTEELAACDLYIARVEEYLAAIRAGTPARVRVKRVCTLTGTLLLILLLI